MKKNLLLEYDMFKGAKPSTFEKANILRHDMTEAENILWQALRNRQVSGYKFRRQHPLNHFILDFYCTEKNLAIEVDGDVHDREVAKEYDENRTIELGKMGVKVIRFSNDEVRYKLKDVLDEIKKLL